MIPQSSFRRVLLFAVVVLVYEAGIIAVVGLDHAPTSDEKYFVAAIRSFGADLSMERVRNYEGVTPPLVFITYSIWGRLWGFDYPALRVFSVILVFVILLSLFVLIDRAGRNRTLALFLPLILMVNPYMVGLTVYVYTDTLMMACAILLCLSLLEKSWLGVFLSAAAGLLSRQYFIVFAVPALLWGIMRWRETRSAQDRAIVLASAFAFLPLLSLFALWQGIGPYEGRKHWPSLASTVFDLHYVNSYIAMIGIYLSPLLALDFRFRRASRTMLLSLIPVAMVYWLFPVKASKLSVMVGGMDTIGLFHRALTFALPYSWMVHFAWFICMYAGLLILLTGFRDIRDAVRKQPPGFDVLLDGMLFAFLLLMPLSYHVWEKYLLPLIPVILTRRAMMYSRQAGRMIDPVSGSQDIRT